MSGAATSRDTQDQVYQAARAGDPDRFASALLAPRPVRDDLVALAAFSGEIRRIGETVSEPHLGEIRLQWWRDALHDGIKGTRSGHPVADRFAEALSRHAIPLSLIDDCLEAHAHTLYTEPPADDAALDLEFDLKEGRLFEVAAWMLGADAPAHEAAVRDAGRAYGATMLALRLPYALARERSPLPPQRGIDWAEPALARQGLNGLAGEARMHLAQLRSTFGALPRPMKTALLPLALVEPHLKVLEDQGHDPVRDLARISPLSRMARLALAHWRGRV
jgi:phytoene synthase